jgi:hypothetical protein
MNDTLNEAVDQIIVNLRTIGKLQINDKIYMNNGFVMIHKDSIMRSLIRHLYGYDRNQSCVIIQDIVMKAMRASSTLCIIEQASVSASNPINFLNYLKILLNLRESFSAVKQGLSNFIKTYADDQTIISRIENLVVHVNNQLSIIDSKLGESNNKIAIQKYFAPNLEQFIASNTPPSFHKYHDCPEQMADLISES